MNSTLDEPDANPGNGSCDSTPSGKCTLRAAIMEANALPGADTIILPPGIYALTIAGASEDAAATGDLDIADTVTISGAGLATTLIDGGGLDRLFDVDPNFTGAALQISGVTIRNGAAPGTESGGGIQVNPLGVLTVSNSLLTHNAANGHGGLVGGGAIVNLGVAALSSVSVISNTAGSVGGGVNNQGLLTFVGVNVISNSVAGVGGGLYNIGVSASASVSASVFLNNQADWGGALEHDGGAVSIVNTLLSGNRAAGDDVGGAIDHIDGTLLVLNSTFADNADPGLDAAGAIWSGGALTLVNNTFFSNTAGIAGGGAINIGSGLSGPGNATITNTTFISNTAGAGGAGLLVTTGTLALKNSIVAGGGPVNCVGAITSRGNNLDSANSCGFTAGGDLKNTNPLVAPPADNGGPVPTAALLPGSPAIDAGSNSACPAADARGVARPQGPACDIGAFELVPVVTSADVDVSQRDEPDPVQPGRLLTYTLVVSNAGPSPALSLMLTDTLPSGVVLAGTAGGGWTCGGAAIVSCTASSLTAGATLTATLRVTVSANFPTLTNTVTVRSSTTDPNLVNNTSVETTTVLLADLAVSQNDNPDPVQSGALLTYTLAVTNAGPSLASGVILTDALPAGVVLVDVAGGGWPCNGASAVVTCTTANLAAGATLSATVHVSVTVSSGTLTNTVTVRTGTADPNLVNNSSIELTAVTVSGVKVYLPIILR